MKHILLFGAGKSATVLIDYLKQLSTEKNYIVTVADGNLEQAQSKVGNHSHVIAAKADVENNGQRKELIKQADVVISLLPPGLHFLVAKDCILYNKHLLTASYIDDNLLKLKGEIEAKGLLFLCEMGLDPGIDHMSAMHLIHRIKALNGKITMFKSHCGGLVAPESDDNPWHYKVSWNPKNVVLAGKAGAVYKENNEVKNVSYEDLFVSGEKVEISNDLVLAYYPNRDSLSYIPVYGLEDCATFIRTTLRHPDFCFGWKNLVDLKLTNETVTYDTDNMTLADFFKTHFEVNNFGTWLNEMLNTRLTFAKDLMNNLMQLMEAENELSITGGNNEESIMLVDEEGQLNRLDVDDVKNKAATVLSSKMHEANLALKQLFFLGLDSNELINKGKCTPAEILQFILEKKLALEPNDKDMVVMMHEIKYEAQGIENYIKSSLVVKGEDNVHTAMAKTVGLPLGIAAKLILDGSLQVAGLHIPIHESIYTPVLLELEKNGIVFEETLVGEM